MNLGSGADAPPAQVNIYADVIAGAPGNNGVHQRETREARFLMIYICLESI